MNKKAVESAYEGMIWIASIIVIIMTVVSIIFLLNNGVNKYFEIGKIEQKILMQRFVYSESCLAYEDEKINSGIIDKIKFNQKNLENCFQATEKIGVKLTLNSNDFRIINLNNKISDKLEFCFDKKHFTCTNYTYYTLINDGNKMERGTLNINIITLK